jgi:hypothetical protein
MNKFEFFQKILLASNGAVEVVSVDGLTDETIYRPNSEKEFFENIQLDENGKLKIYVIGSVPLTPTPSITPTITPTNTPTPTPTRV